VLEGCCTQAVGESNDNPFFSCGFDAPPNALEKPGAFLTPSEGVKTPQNTVLTPSEGVRKAPGFSRALNLFNLFAIQCLLLLPCDLEAVSLIFSYV
jgi:hypothetical protein